MFRVKYAIDQKRKIVHVARQKIKRHEKKIIYGKGSGFA